MRDQRDQRIITLGHRLENVIAADYTKGIRQLETEKVMAATGPAKGESSGVRGSGTTSATERNACEAHRLGELIENLRDARDGAEIAIAHLAKLASEATRTRAFGLPTDIEPAAADEPRCRDNQVGRTGTVPTAHDVGWGRPDCLELPTKAGLCGACYQRERRWRAAHDLPARDIEEAA